MNEPEKRPTDDSATTGEKETGALNKALNDAFEAFLWCMEHTFGIACGLLVLGFIFPPLLAPILFLMLGTLFAVVATFAVAAVWEPLGCLAFIAVELMVLSVLFENFNR